MLGIHIEGKENSRGWFGKGMGNALFSIVVLVLLAGGTAFGIFAAVSGRNTNNANTNVPTVSATPAPITAGTIQVPDGPKIKVVFNGPPELKATWEKLGMAPDGFQVQLVGTLENVSNQPVKFSEIGFLFDKRQVAYVQGRTLNPGETMKILKGFPGYSENTKVLEVRIKGFAVIGGATTAPTSTTPGPTTNPKPTPSPAVETPGKVGIIFLELITQGKYSEAEKLLSPRMLKLVKENGWDAEFSKTKAAKTGRPLTGLWVAEEYIEGDRAHGINIKNNNDENVLSFDSVLIDGRWKIDRWYY